MQFHYVYLICLTLFNLIVFRVVSSSQTGKLSLRFFNYVQALATNNSTDLSECVAQIKHLNNVKELSIKFNDAWGDIPSGILRGNNLDLGNFDECVNIIDDDITGKYCLSSFPVQPLLSYEQNVVSTLRIGTCLPKACTAQSLDDLFKKFLISEYSWQPLTETTLLTDINCTFKERTIKTFDWVALALAICLFCFLLISTSYDYISTIKKRPLNKFLASFSLRLNTRDLFRINLGTTQFISCLQGIRCLSTIWIVYGHTCMMSIIAGNINPMSVSNWLQRFDAMIWHNFAMAVDTFFLLSGFLLILSTFKEMDRNNGHLNIPLLYLQRYLRLTPVLATALLFFMSWFRIITNGPQSNAFTFSADFCDKSWWATLLYIQNYVTPGKLCFGHGWYLAVDMQLTILSPIVLILIWKWQRKGIILTTFITAAFVVSLFFIILFNDLMVFSPKGNLGEDTPTMRYTYYPTHARTSAFLIGIIFGYYRHIGRGKRVRVSKFAVILGWATSFALLIFVIFVLYPKTQLGAILISPVEGAFYLPLIRVAWPLALCWIIFACVNGYGGFINEILSWTYWQPLSKLSYAIYIWHLLIIMMSIGAKKTNSYFSDYTMAFSFWGYFGISLCISVVIYLTIEAPFSNIQNLLLKKEIPIPPVKSTESLEELRP